jgi:putative Ca2+/H+ antiporter (TMEM165/GDT1 family)
VQEFISSFLLVFVSEMGDKTQLLSLVLVARYKRPWTILLGVLIATVLNHALASWAGAYVSRFLSEQIMKWVLAATFFAFAAWILVPDKEGEIKDGPRFGVLLTTVISFFIAEMGDKTQLATVALGAKFENVVLVTVGSTVGMLGSNALAVFLGEKLLRKIPMGKIRAAASILFLLFGLGILVGY